MKKLKTCSVEGCDKAHYARGWCEMHYARVKRHGDVSFQGYVNSPPTPHTALSPVFRTGTPEQRRRFRDEVTNKINRYFGAGYADKIDAMLTDPMDWYQPAQNEVAA